MYSWSMKKFPLIRISTFAIRYADGVHDIYQGDPIG